MAPISTQIAKKILVTGATGKQGGAVVKALLANPPPFEYEILALTRNTASPAAQALASNKKVSLISGNLDDVPLVFQQAGGIGSIWGVFSVQVPAMAQKKGASGENKEVEQGTALIDASITYGVTHFVYTSVDRRGDESDKNPTNVSHFITKHKIEAHLREKAEGKDMTYTILRPVAFMENMTPNLPGRGFAAMWAQMGGKKLQLVSVKDIGIFAAQAFATPETDEYKNAAISLAGDDLTQAEGNDVFWKAMGRPMPISYGFVATLLKKMIPELGIMFRWFVDVGYGSDVAKCKMLNSRMLDLEAWLKEESKFMR